MPKSFFSEIFGNCQGYLCIETISGEIRVQNFYEYPDDLPFAQEDISESGIKKGTNVYFYPVLFKGQDIASGVVCDPVISTDLNMLSPTLITPIPDIVVESSKGRFQAYWLKTDGIELTPLSVNGVLQVNTKLRRVPGTYNFKYHGDPFRVRQVNLDSLDTCDKVRKRYDLFGSQFESLFRGLDRWTLARTCARLGAGAQDIFLVLQSSQQRYIDTGIADLELVKPITELYKEALSAVASSKVPSLLTDEEMKERNSLREGDGFVEQYVRWASSCTDSPWQFHIAGALTILSSLLCPHLRLPTAFGEFRPNLWFMILAGTTITRKTTAMRLAVSLLKEITKDPILSTGGTSEGITSDLSDRDGRSSLFLKDEITGFISEMSSKQYMAGMLETLTKLYDGEEEKRTLRRQTIHVEDPNFNILCGGIKDKMVELLDVNHIASGFLPRFLVVCGWSGIEDMKPIGPPIESNDKARSELILVLEKLYNKYSKRPPKSKITVTNIMSTTSSKAHVMKMNATDEAWNRMRRLEADVREMGMASDNPDVFGPIYERMMNSIIKVSMLIAAERAVRTDVSLVLELSDLVTAISYADIWIESAYEIARNIDDKPSDEERKLQKIEKFVKDNESVTRAKLMQQFRLTAKQMNDIEATLVQRGKLLQSKVGRGTVYRSVENEVV